MGHCEHGLAGAGRADQHRVAGVVEEPQRGQLADELLIDTGLGGEVEVVDRVGRGQRREPQQPGLPASMNGGDLDREQPLQRRDQRQVFGAGGVEHA
jgi:hypothetical protein